jgi:hypothetical protein
MYSAWFEHDDVIEVDKSEERKAKGYFLVSFATLMALGIQDSPIFFLTRNLS